MDRGVNTAIAQVLELIVKRLVLNTVQRERECNRMEMSVYEAVSM